MNTKSCTTTTALTSAEGTTSRWVTEDELERRLAEERRHTKALLTAVAVQLLQGEEDESERISPSRTYGAARLRLVRSD